jgi:hypothetical protein
MGLVESGRPGREHLYYPHKGTFCLDGHYHSGTQAQALDYGQPYSGILFGVLTEHHLPAFKTLSG